MHVFGLAARVRDRIGAAQHRALFTRLDLIGHDHTSSNVGRPRAARSSLILGRQHGPIGSRRARFGSPPRSGGSPVTGSMYTEGTVSGSNENVPLHTQHWPSASTRPSSATAGRRALLAPPLDRFPLGVHVGLDV